MESKRFTLKTKAVELRRRGLSIKTIEKELRVSRSTLSGWLKNVQLSERQKKQLLQNRLDALIAGRRKAVVWHKAQKEERIIRSQQKALRTLSKINLTDISLLELALAILYLGEGSKKTAGTSLGSSDPMILKFFVTALQAVYQIDITNIRAELHLRADQNVAATKQYWAETMGLPLENFTYVSVDKRTIGSKTYPSYNGVCHLRCGNVDIQRRLIFLSTLFCEKVIREYAGS